MTEPPLPEPEIHINIRCPEMGYLVWTSVMMRESAAKLAKFNQTTGCSACGGTHAWTEKDIVFPSSDYWRR